jgi:hypothetical protein
MGWRLGQLSEGRHALTLQRLAVTVKLTSMYLAAIQDVPGVIAETAGPGQLSLA